MSSASPSDLKFQIGQVLFIDIVGYPKLLMMKIDNLLIELEGYVLSF
jgi:hypothetical protein